MTNRNSAALAAKSTTAPAWYSSHKAKAIPNSILRFSPNSRAPVPGPDLIHCGLICIEAHQVGCLATHSPAGIISVDRLGFPYRGPQLLVGRAHLASGPTQGILSEGPLSQLQPSQSLQHRWHLPYRNPDLVVEGVSCRHPPLPHSVGGGPVLVGGPIRVLSSDFAAPGRAPADPHPVLSYSGPGQGW